MEALAPTNDFQTVISEEIKVFGHKLKPGVNESEFDSSKEVCVPTDESSPLPVDKSSHEGENSKGNDDDDDSSDKLVMFINETLTEEELGNKPCMLHDSLALQATDGSGSMNKMTCGSLEMVIDISPDSPGVQKKRSRDQDGHFSEHHTWSHRQSANNNAGDESELLEMHDDVLICSNSQTCNETGPRKAKEMKSQCRGEPNNKGRASKKTNTDVVKQIVDLRSILMQCAQAVENFDNKTLNDLLTKIRQHCSPKGDGMERTAHYFANAIEAHISGNGTSVYVALEAKRISTVSILKAHKMFVIACPFRHMSNILANRAIGNLARRATTLHVIDFGILYGFQWPCLIHALSKRPGGPPKLRLTGIDFPQSGFWPAERVEDTCRRLGKYCERFGVPFEYKAIAQKWDSIKLEDLKIEKNHELVVVNCMYRLHNVPDETETGDSPRDGVLNLIKKINPELFVHGVANGKYNSPFFFTRFKEALFHFCTMFDMFEATVAEDDEDRLVYEQQFLGKEAMNIIACDGPERVERPETYKHWQARTARAGFRQVSLDQEIVKRLNKVKTRVIIRVFPWRKTGSGFC